MFCAMAQRERYLALCVQGSRHNIGVKYGLLRSQLALALAGDDRDDILTELLELVATSRKEG
jgi:UTP--glucose-1-phosphate uridylyltransferase